MAHYLDENVREQFINSCKLDKVRHCRILFSRYLDCKSLQSQFVFEQGLMMATKNGAVEVVKYLLNKNNFKLSPLRYSVVFDFQEMQPNLEILEVLCLQLEDKDELIKIKEEGKFKNKQFYIEYLNVRFEHEQLNWLFDHELNKKSDNKLNNTSKKNNESDFTAVDAQNSENDQYVQRPTRRMKI